MFSAVPSEELSHRSFATPEDILVHRGLPSEECSRLLEAWKLELEGAIQFAADRGGMSGSLSPAGTGPSPRELLQRVNACRRLLRETANQSR